MGQSRDVRWHAVINKSTNLRDREAIGLCSGGLRVDLHWLYIPQVVNVYNIFFHPFSHAYRPTLTTF
jgi:hypothetical protein